MSALSSSMPATHSTWQRQRGRPPKNTASCVNCDILSLNNGSLVDPPSNRPVMKRKATLISATVTGKLNQVNHSAVDELRIRATDLPKVPVIASHREVASIAMHNDYGELSGLCVYDPVTPHPRSRQTTESGWQHTRQRTLLTQSSPSHDTRSQSRMRHSGTAIVSCQEATVEFSPQHIAMGPQLRDSVGHIDATSSLFLIGTGSAMRPIQINDTQVHFPMHTDLRSPHPRRCQTTCGRVRTTSSKKRVSQVTAPSVCESIADPFVTSGTTTFALSATTITSTVERGLCQRERLPLRPSSVSACSVQNLHVASSSASTALVASTSTHAQTRFNSRTVSAAPGNQFFDTVRGKTARENLNGYSCLECQKVF